MLGTELKLTAEIRNLIKLYPQVFPNFFYYDTPALQEKINFIKLSLAARSLQDQNAY